MKKMWISKKECTGCEACANVCPKNAIKMIPDKSGFLYPIVGSECIECGLCENVCKNRIKINKQSYQKKIYAAWSKNYNTRFNSTSGGAFTELAKIILKDKGYVIATQYNELNQVEHIMIDSEDGLDKLRQSKYAQSNIGLVYRKIKEKLINKCLVAFCGTPCQVAALYSFLGKPYDSLVTIDFICRGVNSPKAFSSWLSEIENQNQSKVKKVWFKYKEDGWRNSPRCTKIDFENNISKVYKGDNNLFMLGYLNYNLYIRPSCSRCEFKGIKRNSDITLADFWGIDIEKDEDLGTSLIMVNSGKGQKYFDVVKDKMIIIEENLDKVYSSNGCFEQSVEIDPRSNKFLEELNDNNFTKIYKKYCEIEGIRKIVLRIRKLLRKIILRCIQ